ncbi:MAG TPA: hypothetical protein VKO20_09975 [Desulfosalsimonadaceae bacterium]|nr:hypothetical protein [Desulfosalsimonadaceae bacterium]
MDKSLDQPAPFRHKPFIASPPGNNDGIAEKLLAPRKAHGIDRSEIEQFFDDLTDPPGDGAKGEFIDSLRSLAQFPGSQHFHGVCIVYGNAHAHRLSLQQPDNAFCIPSQALQVLHTKKVGAFVIPVHQHHGITGNFLEPLADHAADILLRRQVEELGSSQGEKHQVFETRLPIPLRLPGGLRLVAVSRAGLLKCCGYVLKRVLQIQNPLL